MTSSVALYISFYLNFKSLYESLNQNYNIFLGYPRPAGKGQRVIMMGMGTKDGWVKGSLRVWKHRRDGPKSEDYHADIDGDSYEKWIRECLELVPPNSVFVFDNAPYHSKKIENCTPRSTWKKQELKEWLESKNIGNRKIPFSSCSPYQGLCKTYFAFKL